MRTDLAVRGTVCGRTWAQVQAFSWLVLCVWETCSKPQFPQAENEEREVGQLPSRVREDEGALLVLAGPLSPDV